MGVVVFRRRGGCKKSHPKHDLRSWEKYLNFSNNHEKFCSPCTSSSNKSHVAMSFLGCKNLSTTFLSFPFQLLVRFLFHTWVLGSSFYSVLSRVHTSPRVKYKYESVEGSELYNLFEQCVNECFVIIFH